jgi:hypothetical protein
MSCNSITTVPTMIALLGIRRTQAKSMLGVCAEKFISEARVLQSYEPTADHALL